MTANTTSAAEPQRQTLLVIGGSGHGSDVLSIIEAIADQRPFPYDVVVSDEGSPDPKRFDSRGVSVALGSKPEFKSDSVYVAGVGYPASRRAVVEAAESHSCRAAAPIIHPTVVMATGSTAGNGTVIAGLTWISALATIGDHVYVGYGVNLGHDTEVEDFVSIMPGATIGGCCVIGKGALIGANATILQNLAIGAGAQVGAGSVVTRDVPPGATVMGVPAKERGASPA